MRKTVPRKHGDVTEQTRRCAEYVLSFIKKCVHVRSVLLRRRRHSPLAAAAGCRLDAAAGLQRGWWGTGAGDGDWAGRRGGSCMTWSAGGGTLRRKLRSPGQCPFLQLRESKGQRDQLIVVISRLVYWKTRWICWGGNETEMTKEIPSAKQIFGKFYAQKLASSGSGTTPQSYV